MATEYVVLGPSSDPGNWVISWFAVSPAAGMNTAV
jgi:hypothetical protein